MPFVEFLIFDGLEDHGSPILLDLDIIPRVGEKVKLDADDHIIHGEVAGVCHNLAEPNTKIEIEVRCL